MLYVCQQVDGLDTLFPAYGFYLTIKMLLTINMWQLIRRDSESATDTFHTYFQLSVKYVRQAFGLYLLY